MKKQGALIGLFVLALAISGQAKIPLKTEFQDTQPKFIRAADGSFSGLCVELMHLIEANSSFTFDHPADFIPKTRIDANLEAGIVDLHFGLAKTASREKLYLYVEPLYEVRNLLIANSSDPISIASVEELVKAAKSDKVIAIGGTNQVEYLRSLGIEADAGSTDVELSLDKLAAKRGRLLLYHDLGLYYLIDGPRYRGKFKVLPLRFEPEFHWLVLSKKSPKAGEAEALRSVIAGLKKSGAWASVVDRYLKQGH